MLIRALLLSVALVAIARPADACVGRCASTSAAHASGFPSNASGLPVDGEAKDFTLLDGDQKPIALQVKEGILAPAAGPFAPGEYDLQWKGGCNSFGKDEGLHFTVRAEAPVPAESGILSFKSASRTIASFPSSDYKKACSDEADVAIVDLDLIADPSLEPYREVLSWVTKVDGGDWSVESPIADSSTSPHPAYSGVAGKTRLFAFCDGNPGGIATRGLSQGPHQVEVRAVVPGLPAIAPAKLQVTISCPEAGPAPAGSTAADAASSEQGCSSSGRAATTLPGWLLALGVLLVARKRKSRRSNASGKY